MHARHEHYSSFLSRRCAPCEIYFAGEFPAILSTIANCFIPVLAILPAASSHKFSPELARISLERASERALCRKENSLFGAQFELNDITPYANYLCNSFSYGRRCEINADAKLADNGNIQRFFTAVINSTFYSPYRDRREKAKRNRPWIANISPAWSPFERLFPTM